MNNHTAECQYRQCLKNILCAIAKKKGEPIHNFDGIPNQTLERIIQNYNQERDYRYPSWIKTEEQKKSFDSGCEYFDNHKHDE